jgi:hypothetical protein
MRRRRLLLPLVVAAVLVVGVLMGPSLAARLQHPRDVDAFQTYVVTYMPDSGSPADENWATEHPDDVLAEGDRACEWLSQRPSAPDVDPSGASSVPTLTNAYLKQARGEPEVPLTREGHRTLVVGAWGYLCWSERRDKSAPFSEDED